MRGESPLSRKTLVESLRRLNAPLEFLNQAESMLSNDLHFEEISDDEFEIISKWWHYAILELMTMPGYSLTIDSASKKLDLKPAVVESALGRLEKLGFIRQTKAGYVLARGNTTSYPTSRTSMAKIQSQQDLLKLSLNSLAADEIDLRDHSSVILAVSKDALPEAKAVITEARRKLTKLIQKNKNFTDVYCLQISFFPLRGRTEPGKE